MSYEGFVEPLVSTDHWSVIRRVYEIDHFYRTPIEDIDLRDGYFWRRRKEINPSMDNRMEIFSPPAPDFEKMPEIILLRRRTINWNKSEIHPFSWVYEDVSRRLKTTFEKYKSLIEDFLAEYTELETSSTPAVDAKEEHRKPTGFDVKEAAMLPRVKQHLPDDRGIDESLLPSFSTGQDDTGGVISSIFTIPSSARSSTKISSLGKAARSWYQWSEEETETLLWNPLRRTEFDQFLYPALKAGFAIHQVEAPDMMLVQDPLAQVQPEHVEEASFDSSCNWKKRHQIHDPVVADLPSSADCLEPGDETDSESEATDVLPGEKILSSESGASVDSGTEIATADSHGPRTEPSRKRSAASAFDKDNLSAQIRSYVDQQIEKAFLPLLSALRSREEDEHKHRQKILALEQEKLALMRQKLECTRRSNAVPASAAN